MKVSNPEFNPLIGASVGSGIKPLKDFIRLKLGNIVLTSLPDTVKEAEEVMDFCRENKIYIMLSEIVHRGNHKRWSAHSMSKDEIESVIKRAGKYFIGRYVIGEAGGILYWPKFYTINGGVGEYRSITPCDGEIAARKAYVDYLKSEIEFEKNEICNSTFFNVESSIIFSTHTEAGINGQCLELLPGDPLITLAAVRGAAKSAKQLWGVHIAMMWYGGIRLDELWQKRWRSSLYLSYLSGAGFIYPESSHFEYTIKGEKNYTFSAPELKRMRKELRQLYCFSKIHNRPDCAPESPIAIIRGFDDGHPGIWNPYAWGQYEKGEEWQSSDAENGWRLFDTFFKRQDFFFEHNTGDYDFSGNPPCGQLDIIPADGDFSSYKMLFFVGVNRMDDKLYSKLAEYVKKGGHLIIALSHFDCQTVRGGELQLFRNGNLSELCGFNVTTKGIKDVHGISFINHSSDDRYDFPCKTADRDPLFNGNVTGMQIEITDPELKIIAGLSDKPDNIIENIAAQPLLTEHKLGKGTVFTITALESPGTPGLHKFTDCLVWKAIKAHTGEFDFITSDRVRYAIYNTSSGKQFYLYNLDPDLTQSAVIIYNNKRYAEILLSPGEFKCGYLFDNIIIIPDVPVCNAVYNNGDDITFISDRQNVVIINSTEETKFIKINNKNVELAANEKKNIELSENIPPELKEFFAPEFLEEPEMTMSDTSTPY